MGALRLDELDESGLVDLDTLKSILGEGAASGSESFAVEASLLDYMVDDYPRILSFWPGSGGLEYEFSINWPNQFPEEKKAEVRNRIRDGLLRGGVVTNPNIDQVMDELRSQDDVIIGIDGNILRDCILTSTLLEEIYSETYPNWILIGIPRLVMSEIEGAAKERFTKGDHPLVGWPTYEGRIGQRALQEVMDLREKNPDRPGLAMVTIGELQRGASEVEREDWKIDALIRDQFKGFLDDIGFHKGTYFLSQDRVNVMMSGTEGGDALYLQKPEFKDVDRGMASGDELTSLVYELCVQFGGVRIRSEEDGNVQLELEIYWPGKQVSDWDEARLNVVAVRP